MTNSQSPDRAELADELAKALLMNMFAHDAQLIEGWKSKSDVKWLVALGFVTDEVLPYRSPSPYSGAAGEVGENVNIHAAGATAMSGKFHRPRCKLCGLEDGACICAHIPTTLPRDAERETELLSTYRDIFAEITAKATPVCAPTSDDPERVRHYIVPVGPIHRAAGKVGFQMFNGEQHLANAIKEIERLKAREDDCSCGGGDISGHDTSCPYARDAERETIEPEELEALIADKSASRAADAILKEFVVTRALPSIPPRGGKS